MFYLAATALYMKIQHLESLLPLTNSVESLEIEIMETYTILVNTLLCLISKDRWIAVEKVVKFKDTTLHNDTGAALKKLKTHNKPPIEVKRVALKLSDIKAEHQVYVKRHQHLVVQNLNFNGF